MLLTKGPRLRRLVLLGVLLHGLFIATAEFEHHDFLCHEKTPQHCAACAVSTPGSNPRTPVAPGACLLADAGQAVAVQVVSKSAVLTVRTRGRSPPPTS
jgi:hypothetical protein